MGSFIAVPRIQGFRIHGLMVGVIPPPPALFTKGGRTALKLMRLILGDCPRKREESQDKTSKENGRVK